MTLEQTLALYAWHGRHHVAQRAQEVPFVRAYDKDKKEPKYPTTVKAVWTADGVTFGLPYGSTYTLAFARLLYGQEVLVAYNVSAAARKDRVVVDGELHKAGDTMTYLYPQGKADATVEKALNGTLFIRIDLDGHQLAILDQAGRGVEGLRGAGVVQEQVAQPQ